MFAEAPQGRFNPSTDWQAPPKWMFTVLPVHRDAGINWDADALEYRVRP
jgi:hypothetical protein